MQTIHLIAGLVLVVILVAIGYGIYSGVVGQAGDSLNESGNQVIPDQGTLIPNANYGCITKCTDILKLTGKVQFLPQSLSAL